MTTNMMKACLVIVLTCFVMSTSAMYAVTNGNCPEVAAEKDFDIQRYMGRWYLYEAFETPVMTSLTCPQMDYSLKHNGEIEITNSGSDSITMFGHPLWSSDVTIKGRAIIANSSRPAEWVVSMGEDGAFDEKPNYIIMGTDYINYSLVYSCTEPTKILHFKIEFAWILSRRRNERPADDLFLKYQLRTYNINSTFFKPMLQIDCD